MEDSIEKQFRAREQEFNNKMDYELDKARKELEMKFDRKFEALNHINQMKQQEMMSSANELVSMLDQKISNNGVFSQKVISPLLIKF